MREITTETKINAPAATVWRILTDFKRFPSWNPFIPKAEGALREGAQLKVRIEPPGGMGMTFRPRITRLSEKRELRWLGRLFIPGLFDGEHHFEIKPLGEDAIQFVQREQFKGILVPLLWRSLDKNTRQGFEEMNAALKKRAEQEASA